MDNFLNKLEQLADLAAQRPDPRPLAVGGVMARVRGLEIEDDSQTIPLRFFAGGAVAAAAAAVVVSLLAVSSWTEATSPLVAMNSMFDVMDMML